MEWVQSGFTVNVEVGQSGYSHTGAFYGKPLSNDYVWEAGAGIHYTQTDATNGLDKVLSLDIDVHLAVDFHKLV